MAAPGSGLNGFDTRLYVLLLDHGVVVQVDPSGAMTRFVKLPRRVIGDCAPLTFDVQGNYGRGLLFGGKHNRIGRISASGSISYLRSVEVSRPRTRKRTTRGLECDPFGVFEGRLFLTDDADAIFEVDERGRMELLTNARRATVGGGGGHAMAVSPGGAFGAFLYVADTTGRRILRISPDHTPGEAAPLWLDLSELQVEPTGLAISLSGPFGTEVMYVLDEQTDRVLGFDADGSFLGSIVSDVKYGSSIELPRTGLFRNTMVIVSHDSISIVRSVDTPGYEHHPGPIADYDNDHDVDEVDLIGLLDDLDCAGPGCAGDLNKDGRTDVQDIHVFLDVMFEGEE